MTFPKMLKVILSRKRRSEVEERRKHTYIAPDIVIVIFDNVIIIARFSNIVQA